MTRKALILGACIACAAFAGSPPLAAQDTSYVASLSLYHAAGMPVTILSDDDISDPAYSAIEGILDYPLSRMAFEGALFQEILQFLQEVYGITIELDLDSNSPRTAANGTSSRNARMLAQKIAYVDIFATTFRNALCGLLNPLGLNYELAGDTIRIASLDAHRPPARGQVFVSSGKFEKIEGGALRVGGFFARLGVHAELEPQPNAYCRMLAKSAISLNGKGQTARIELFNPTPLEYIERVSDQQPSMYAIRQSDKTTGMTVEARLEGELPDVTRVILDMTVHYLSHRAPLSESSLRVGKPDIVSSIEGTTYIPVGKQIATLIPLPEPHGGVFVLLVEVTKDPSKD